MFYIQKEKIRATNIINDALYLINTVYEEMNIEIHKISFKCTVDKTDIILKTIDSLNENPILDFYHEVINSIIKEGIQFVGISITGSDQLIPAILLAKLIKKYCCEVKHITFGGNFITRLSTDWVKPSSFFSFC